MQALRNVYNVSKLHRIRATTCVASSIRQRCSCTSTATAVYVAPTEAHVQHLAAMLARERLAGDCYCLFGSVGAGKSVFSRAFIRAAADDPSLPVPSPTYLLQLIYDEQEGPPIHHFDLYRLDAHQDMSRLDLSSSFQTAVNLIEWSERLPQQLLPEQRLEVHIQIQQTDQLQQQERGSAASTQSRQLDTQGIVVLRTPERLGIAHTQQEQYGSESEQLPSWDTGDEEYSEPDDEYEELFSDKRERRVELRAVGDGWVARLQQLAVEMQ